MGEPPPRAASSSSPGDTAPCDAAAVAAREADVLVHEATFAEEEARARRETGHGPPARRPSSRATPGCACSR